MKRNILLLLIITTTNIFSQRKYNKEFSFLNDNDLYTSTFRDRYYTNGMFFSYRTLSNKTHKKSSKKVYEYQLGHEMYTPFKATVDLKGEHDRPFAAYLYGSFGIKNFYKKSALKTSLQIGTIGSNALGWELQDLIHDIYGFKKAIGWNYQIKNAFALNLNTTYEETLLKNNLIDFTWNNQARIGTVFTDFSSGLTLRLGIKPLQPINNSIAFNSNLNNKSTNQNNNTEWFFFIKPMVHYVVYDATIQGSFLNTTSPITFEVEPIKFTTQLGIQFTANRFNLGYFFNYHTKKLKSIRVPEWNNYGTIVINYQFN